jgi:hypothetical protein
MNDLGAILHHFVACIFDISTRATVAGCIADQFHLLIRINAEGTLPILQRSEALPTSTLAVTIANNDADFRLRSHFFLLSQS